MVAMGEPDPGHEPHPRDSGNDVTLTIFIVAQCYNKAKELKKPKFTESRMPMTFQKSCLETIVPSGCEYLQ